MSESFPFVVAGHLCLDLTPVLKSGLPQPGGLAEAGALHFSCGGAVGNVGPALWRLGWPVRLVSLVGNDRLGEIAGELLRPLGNQKGIRIAPGQMTSYSIVLAAEGIDRGFLHCPGANAVFTSVDVRDEDLEGAGWLHFGYPPVMPAIAGDGGKELAALFHRAKERGLRTSLDFCSISGGAAATDWRTVLSNCAREVTVFAPSLPELRAALREPARETGDIGDVGALARMLIDMGFAIVAVKLGMNGMYLATTDDGGALASWGFGTEWPGRELMAPCFRVQAVNTTGSGDCAIAGLIAAIVSGYEPEAALTMAAAAGACSVEGADSASAMRSMAELRARIESGWERMESIAPGENWTYNSRRGIWNGKETRRKRGKFDEER